MTYDMTGAKWLSTPDGTLTLTRRDGFEQYYIPGGRLGESDWIDHIRRKAWATDEVMADLDRLLKAEVL